MASRKRQDGEKPAAKARPARTRAPWPRWRIDRNAVVMGDVRPAPAAVRQEGETYTPDIAVWAQAESGMAWGVFIGPPGQRAQTLVQALFEPRPPPFEPRQTLPRQLILFDDTLAGEVRETLSDSRVEIALSERFESFETMFTALLEQLAAQADPTLHLPDDAIAALCAASARLWRAKPWQFAYDEPAIELKPQRGSAPPLYASILGGNREVLGAALYTVLEDYEHDRELGMTLEESDTDLDTPDVADELDVAEMAAAMAHEAQLHGRVFLVSFDEKEDMEPAYREQLTRNGWPGRLSVVPTFIARGGSGTAEATPNDVTADEARHIALAIEALVTFCERHEDALAAEEFPIRDTVEIKQAGETVKIDVAAPAGEGETSTATVLRFKVSLKNNKRVWRRID
ncbi:MAG: hypothetical protein ACRDI2_23135, partial [Chloroflexota bacterium]